MQFKNQMNGQVFKETDLMGYCGRGGGGVVGRLAAFFLAEYWTYLLNIEVIETEKKQLEQLFTAYFMHSNVSLY